MEINFRFIGNVVKMFFRGKGKAFATWFWEGNEIVSACLVLVGAAIGVYLAGWVFILIGHYFAMLVGIFGLVISYEGSLGYFFIGIGYTGGLILFTYTIVGLTLFTKWVKRNLLVAIRDAMELENK